MVTTSTASEIGQNLARLRRRRGLTLDGLAELSSISRAAISALENGSSNPRIETLWSLANALGIEFGELFGGRSDVELTEAVGIRARLIDRQSKPRPVESFLMDLLANAKRYADAHAPGVTENVIVLAGSIAIGPVSSPMLLRAGQSHQFAADVPHLYSAGSEACRAIVTVIYPESDPTTTSEDLVLDWPSDKEGWAHVRTQLDRARIEIQNGCMHSRMIFKNAPEGSSATRIILNHIDIENEIKDSVRMYVTALQAPVISIFYRSHQMRSLIKNENNKDHLNTSCRNLAEISIAPWVHKIDKDKITSIAQGSNSIIEATLAAELLTRIGCPTVPKDVAHKKESIKKKILQSASLKTALMLMLMRRMS